MKSPKSPRLTLPISGELRRRINQAAHAEGLRQEIAARARIVQELRLLAAKGAGADAIGAYLDRVERA
ncbi:hypothetical protein [Variovorax sp. WS11]|uniref:hypothetical protein n=1 Tax=Variovorax sp. WS11 TaxID=1105204 RepID=UPI0011B1DC98|nr:hypothetical protein [Variovorax sp. WS11]NDZ15556.1 hypothetical protein [Variovorax sp. WS11]